MVRILIVEEGYTDIYGKIFEKRFRELGCEVYGMYLHTYFKNYPYDKVLKVDNNFIKKVYYKFQNKYSIGPVIYKINRDIIKFVIKYKIDLVFIYRNNHIWPATIKKLKKLGVKVFDYNNDDPFSLKHPKYKWKNYFNSLNLYDHIFVFRQKNVIDLKKLGYKNVNLLRAYYIKERNFYIPNIKNNRYNCDVIFVGHWENDGRDEYLKLLLDNDIDLKIYGILWENSKYYKYFLSKMKMNKITYLSKDYNLAINSAKIALVFLSKLNNDTYTRRCFEIPATKTMMMAEYTDDLANNLFKESKEAEYFRNKEELLQKVQYYLKNKNKIKEIGENGYKRLIKDNHEAVDRCKKIIGVYNEL